MYIFNITFPPPSRKVFVCPYPTDPYFASPSPKKGICLFILIQMILTLEIRNKFCFLFDCAKEYQPNCGTLLFFFCNFFILKCENGGAFVVSIKHLSRFILYQNVMRSGKPTTW